MNKKVYLSCDILHDMRDAFLEYGDRLDPDSMDVDWDDLYVCIIEACVAAIAASRGVKNERPTERSIISSIGSELYSRILAEVEVRLRDKRRSKGTHTGTEERISDLNIRSKLLLSEANFGFYRGIANELSESPIVMDVYDVLDKSLPDEIPANVTATVDPNRVTITLRESNGVTFGTRQWVPDIVRPIRLGS